jgi:hypothetical protein
MAAALLIRAIRAVFVHHNKYTEAADRASILFLFAALWQTKYS